MIEIVDFEGNYDREEQAVLADAVFDYYCGASLKEIVEEYEDVCILDINARTFKEMIQPLWVTTGEVCEKCNLEALKYKIISRESLSGKRIDLKGKKLIEHSDEGLDLLLKALPTVCDECGHGVDLYTWKFKCECKECRASKSRPIPITPPVRKFFKVENKALKARHEYEKDISSTKKSYSKYNQTLLTIISIYCRNMKLDMYTKFLTDLKLLNTPFVDVLIDKGLTDNRLTSEDYKLTCLYSLVDISKHLGHYDMFTTIENDIVLKSIHIAEVISFGLRLTDGHFNITLDTIEYMYNMLDNITIHQLNNIVYHSRGATDIDEFITRPENNNRRKNAYGRVYKDLVMSKILYDKFELSGDKLLDLNTNEIRDIVSRDTSLRILPYDFDPRSYN